jgi:hypothetical protein
MLPHFFVTNFERNEAKKKIFLKKKNQNGRLKKTEFFNHHQKLCNFHSHIAIVVTPPS